VIKKKSHQRLIGINLRSAIESYSSIDDVIFITGTYGLGENIVQGKVNPDEFHVRKPTFKQGYRAVLRRSLGQKQLRLVYAADGHTGSTTGNVCPRA
jgi:pyruvate, water dikinase